MNHCHQETLSFTYGPSWTLTFRLTDNNVRTLREGGMEVESERERFKGRQRARERERETERERERGRK